jgi:hypothetical protein
MTDEPREVLERLIHNARGRNIINPGEVVKLDQEFGLADRRWRASIAGGGKFVDDGCRIVWTLTNPRRPHSDRILIYLTAAEAHAYLDNLTFRALTQTKVTVDLECSCGCRRYCDFHANPDAIAIITTGLRAAIEALAARDTES